MIRKLGKCFKNFLTMKIGVRRAVMSLNTFNNRSAVISAMQLVSKSERSTNDSSWKYL